MLKPGFSILEGLPVGLIEKAERGYGAEVSGGQVGEDLRPWVAEGKGPGVEVGTQTANSARTPRGILRGTSRPAVPGVSGSPVQGSKCVRPFGTVASR